MKIRLSDVAGLRWSVEYEPEIVLIRSVYAQVTD